jgi:hypothetical protein
MCEIENNICADTHIFTHVHQNSRVPSSITLSITHTRIHARIHTHDMKAFAHTDIHANASTFANIHESTYLSPL